MYELKDYKKFLDEIFKRLEKKEVDVSNMEMDHICYRVSTEEEFKQRKEEFSRLGVIVSENIIRNRPIPVFRLKEPLVYRDRKIYCLELPAMGEGDKFGSGLKHAEFVTPDKLSDFAKKYPFLRFIDKTKSNIDNPNIVLELGDNLAVKFHNESLLYLVSRK
jgi:predicted metalloenzyme YecM